MFLFSERSRQKLKGVHPDLEKLMIFSIVNSPLDFGITQGLRTIEEQKKLFDEGKSKTMNSRHLTGHAVDIAVWHDGKISWDFENYKTVAAHIKRNAIVLNIPVRWGGDWVSFKDGPHFELDRTCYKDGEDNAS